MTTKFKVLIFFISVFITAAIFVLIETVIFNESFKHAVVMGLISGLGCFAGLMIYFNYLKRKIAKGK